MRVLAIDPSLRSTGLAGVGWAESVDTRGFTGHHRLQEIRRSVKLYAKGADLAVIEGPAYGAKGRAVHQLAGLWWLLTHDLWRLGIPYAVVDPRTLKMYATNNGNAPKAAVSDAMFHVHPSMRFATDDESDAYAMLTMAHHRYVGGMEMLCCGGIHLYPDHDRVGQCLDNVEWPDVLVPRPGREAA